MDRILTAFLTIEMDLRVSCTKNKIIFVNFINFFKLAHFLLYK